MGRLICQCMGATPSCLTQAERFSGWQKLPCKHLAISFSFKEHADISFFFLCSLSLSHQWLLLGDL